MSRIEDVSNRLADLDWTWWPMLAVRPAREEPITHHIVARTTVFFGPTAALVFAAFLWLDGERRVLVFLTFGLLVTGLFYLFMRSVTARYWNRRAARLRRDQISQVVAAP